MWSNMLPIMVKFGKVKKNYFLIISPISCIHCGQGKAKENGLHAQKSSGMVVTIFLLLLLFFCFFLLFLYNGTIKQNLVKFKYIHIFN